MKLLVAFHSFANAPRNGHLHTQDITPKIHRLFPNGTLITLAEFRWSMEKLHDLRYFLLHRVTGTCLLLSLGLACSKNLQVLEFCEENIFI
jgi:hypothetical protein